MNNEETLARIESVNIALTGLEKLAATKARVDIEQTKTETGKKSIMFLSSGVISKIHAAQDFLNSILTTSEELTTLDWKQIASNLDEVDDWITTAEELLCMTGNTDANTTLH